MYISSEGTFGFLASIYTDEYFLSPTSAFFEFIKEEDVEKVQPKTLLISEIEPGNRYELVCTTEAGLVRYRMGDVINCTRFVSRADDLVPLPSKPVDIPRIPLISIAYRIGSLLDILGEKTNEQQMMNALKQTIYEWRKQGISVDICDFTTYPKLDAFPPHYVIFLELICEQRCKIDDQQLRDLQKIANSEVEQQVCKANEIYSTCRNIKKLGPLTCILVRSGTFSTFLRKELLNGRANLAQIKPYRLLKNEHDIQFFYDNKIDTSSC
ncbi:unnamed protein product [Rotaria sordida]|uniref:Uncharacterized protein n=1 Tax=Rotaria sordida TaxID=392033 RepID=A0A814MGG2_9BILA|nr:unnamed protein product [Rotaria sordida]